VKQNFNQICLKFDEIPSFIAKVPKLERNVIAVLTEYIAAGLSSENKTVQAYRLT
jgi:hypothetical protein